MTSNSSYDEKIMKDLRLSKKVGSKIIIFYVLSVKLNSLVMFFQRTAIKSHIQQDIHMYFFFRMNR